MQRPGPFLRLQIEDDAKAKLIQQARKHGLSQSELTSRLIAWLVTQPADAQAIILNGLRPDLEAQLADALKALLEGGKSKGRQPAPRRRRLK